MIQVKFDFQLTLIKPWLISVLNFLCLLALEPEDKGDGESTKGKIFQPEIKFDHFCNRNRMKTATVCLWGVQENLQLCIHLRKETKNTLKKKNSGLSEE